MKRPVSLFLAALLVTACGSASPPTTEPPAAATTAAVRVYDLTDPATQAEVGSPPFEPVGWQRFVGPFTAVGDRELPNPAEVALMAAAAGDVPPQLAAPVRNIVRTADAPPSHLQGAPVAVALGPDVYLLDAVFTLTGGTTRFNITYALVHEIVHVHQWFALDNDYLVAAGRGETSRLDLADGSTLVRDYADAVGWRNTSADPIRPAWVLDGEPATDYGRTDPAEDMAEAVALAATGRGNWLDDGRRAWVEAFAGATIDELGTGQPWVPSGSVEVSPTAPLYDMASLEPIIGDRTHIEPIYFQLPDGAGDGASIAGEIDAHLQRRGMAGSLAPIPDERAPRWGGAYERDDGDIWWVEVWDFPAGSLEPRPSGAIVLYLMLW